MVRFLPQNFELLLTEHNSKAAESFTDGSLEKTSWAEKGGFA
jgi:hypothetical protein